MTSIGKIARLPREVRHELCRRLDNGEPGVKLVKWLNRLRDVKAALREQFDGRPITEQNLSEWKQRGFRQWQRHEAAWEHVLDMTEKSGEFDVATKGMQRVAISDLTGKWLAAEFSALAGELLEATDDPGERWRQLREILGGLRQLRLLDHERQRIEMQQERWEHQCEDRRRAESKREIAEAKEKALAPLDAMTTEQIWNFRLGKSEAARKLARWIANMQHDLPQDNEGAGDPAELEEAPKPGKSDQIKPSPGGEQGGV